MGGTRLSTQCANALLGASGGLLSSSGYCVVAVEMTSAASCAAWMTSTGLVAHAARNCVKMRSRSTAGCNEVAGAASGGVGGSPIVLTGKRVQSRNSGVTMRWFARRGWGFLFSHVMRKYMTNAVASSWRQATYERAASTE